MLNALLKSLGTTISSVEDAPLKITGIKMINIFDPVEIIKEIIFEKYKRSIMK